MLRTGRESDERPAPPRRRPRRRGLGGLVLLLLRGPPRGARPWALLPGGRALLRDPRGCPPAAPRGAASRSPAARGAAAARETRRGVAGRPPGGGPEATGAHAPTRARPGRRAYWPWTLERAGGGWRRRLG